MSTRPRRKPSQPTPPILPESRPSPEPPSLPPPPQPVPALGSPTGTIPMSLEIAYGRGGPWSEVNQYDDSFVRHGTTYGVRPSMLKAMAVVESGGKMIPNGNGFPNFGIMQLSYSSGGRKTKWEAVGEKLGVGFRTADGQIAIAAYVLGGHDGDRGTPEDIFLSTYYPTAGLDVPGGDGHTPRQYLSDLATLVGIINAAAPSTPAPTRPVPPLPPPVGPVTPAVVVPSGDPLSVIVGGRPTNSDYGFRADVGLAFYHFGVGHGTEAATEHSGVDITLPVGTPLFTPSDGVVDCVGYQGTPRFGQSCGAYNDDAGGPGNITILLDPGEIKLTLGHCRSALVKPGDRVRAGQQVGTSGSSNGPHVHVETSISKNNSYWLVDPRTALQRVTGPSPAPAPAPTKPPAPDAGIWRPYPYPPMVDMIVTKPGDGAGFDRVPFRRPNIRGFCTHITAGGGTIEFIRDFFSTGGARAYDALTDLVLGRDGRIGLLNDWRDPKRGGTRAGWANGGVDGLEGDGVAFYRKFPNINQALVSCEHIAREGEAWTEEQIVASIELRTAIAQELKCSWQTYPLHQEWGVSIEQSHCNFATKSCPAEPYLSTLRPVILRKVKAKLEAWQSQAAPPLPPPDTSEPRPEPTGPVRRPRRKPRP